MYLDKNYNNFILEELIICAIYSKELLKEEHLTLNEQIDRILICGTNMQDNIKLMKKLYKDGSL